MLRLTRNVACFTLSQQPRTPRPAPPCLLSRAGVRLYLRGVIQPVNILNIGGTADELGTYHGGADTIGVILGATIPANMPPFFGAMKTIQTWAGYDGASDPITDA